jgi:hypothetical protein
MAVIEPLFFAVTRVATFAGMQPLTAASGFFFEHAGRVHLVTSRHVLRDDASGHHPDRIAIVIHTDATDLTRAMTLDIPLYRNGIAAWRQGRDSGGEIDVAVIEVPVQALPPEAVVRPFTMEHLQPRPDDLVLGTAVLMVGFPLGFYDTVHNLPVARHATIASPFGVRFQARGCFLTDARTHRGASGAPVVLHDDSAGPTLRWRLLGIHSAGFDMGTRERGVDEMLGLNCVWYADILPTLIA